MNLLVQVKRVIMGKTEQKKAAPKRLYKVMLETTREPRTSEKEVILQAESIEAAQAKAESLAKTRSWKGVTTKYRWVADIEPEEQPKPKRKSRKKKEEDDKGIKVV